MRLFLADHEVLNALLDIRLTADLVTISACRGAGARVIAGEGLVGFAWVLLHAGARHVVAGLWDVNNRPTLASMTRVRRFATVLLGTVWSVHRAWRPLSGQTPR